MGMPTAHDDACYSTTVENEHSCFPVSSTHTRKACGQLYVEVSIPASTVTASVLQADLIGSLQARVDLLMAEADELLAGGVTSALVSARPPIFTPPSAQPDAHIVVPLPARVFFPLQVHGFACHVSI